MPPPASGRAVIAVVDVHTALGNVPIRPFPFFRRVARETGLPLGCPLSNVFENRSLPSSAEKVKPAQATL